MLRAQSTEVCSVAKYIFCMQMVLVQSLASSINKPQSREPSKRSLLTLLSLIPGKIDNIGEGYIKAILNTNIGSKESSRRGIYH